MINQNTFLSVFLHHQQHSVVFCFSFIQIFHNHQTEFTLLSAFSQINSFLFLEQQLFIPNLKINQTWKQNATTVAGGHGYGSAPHQLHYPCGIFIDNDQTIYIADTFNNRTVEWKKDAINGSIIIDRNGTQNRSVQLNWQTKVIIDQENDSFIICDPGNQRVVRWPRRNDQTGEVLISNIYCHDLIMDNCGYLYVSDPIKHEIRRWKRGETNRTIVAGGNRSGNGTNQLNSPSYIFIDEDHSVYVSDENNHRVMKWVKGASEGIVVAGGRGQGNGSRQLSFPSGIIVDQLGSVYVADRYNHRVMRWLKGAEEGTVIVGGNGFGQQPNQFGYPTDLSFDRENNLYVLDHANDRVQRFDVNKNENV